MLFKKYCKSAIQLFYKGYVLGVAWSCLLIIFLLQVLCTGILYLIVDKKHWIAVNSWIFNFIAYYGYTVFLRPLWKVSIFQGSIPKRLPPKCLLMCNHTSHADAWSISRLFWEHNHLWFKYIGKGDLFRVPIAGWVLWLAGDLPVKFNSEKNGWGVTKDNVQTLMEQSSKYVNDYHFPIAVFPEGGCSKTNALQEFKLGYFKFAIQHQCAILPIAISGASKAWCPNTLEISKGTVYFSIHDQFIYPHTDETVEQLMTRVKNIISKMLKQHPQ